jgi:hypothetical protein
MSEESRLGREAIETTYALKQLVTAGVRLLFYVEEGNARSKRRRTRSTELGNSLPRVVSS